MWMVLLQGGWQPAESDEVITAWIRSGLVKRFTPIRHASWATPRNAGDIVAFSHLFGAALSTAPQAYPPPHQGATGYPRPPQYHPRATRMSGGAVAVVAAAAVGAGVGLRHLVSESAGVGVAMVLLVVVGLALMVASQLPGVPPAVRTLGGSLTKRWRWSVPGLAIMGIAAWSGFAVRGERAATCEAAVSKATALKKSGAPSPDVLDAFESAAASCHTAGMADHERTARNQAAAAKEVVATERKAAFDTSIGEARRLAANPGDAAAAVAKFEEAQKVGVLAPADAALLGRQLVAQGVELARSGKHADALAKLRLAQRTDPSSTGVNALIATEEAQVRAESSEAALTAALRVQNSKQACDTPLEVKQAWEGLRAIQPTEPQHARAVKAAAGLERCRKQMIKSLASTMRQLNRDLRVEAASKMEYKLLDEGMDARVRVSGSNKDRLTITYVLLNRAWAHKITDGGAMREGAFLRTMQDAGFRRVTFSDGFYESYYYDLEPEPMDAAAARTMDLPAPLKM